VWSPSTQTLQINTAAGSGGGCTLPSTSYVVRNIVDFGPSYPGYFRGTYSPTSTQTIPVCLVFANNGFSMLLDGQGTCPNPGALATCVQQSAGPLQ
jgi:hypothetical protein